MADLLIRGMEMPKYTTKAEFGIDADGNPLCMVYHEDGTEPDIYDVVPLPEGHRRLIDADALIRAMFTASDGTIMRNTNIDGWHFEMRYKDIKKHIRNAPTIVPAEGGNADGN